MDDYPGYRVVIARKVAKELKATTMASFFKWCPPSAYDPGRGGRNAPTENYTRFCNGSEVLWLHLDDPETENVIRGLEINAFLIDQAEEIQEEIFDLLSMRLGRWDRAQVPQALIDGYKKETGEDWPYWSNETPPRPMPPAYAMLTCNPDTELHWIYRRFHPDSMEHQEKKIPDPRDPDSGRKVSYKDLGYKLLHFSTLDNKFLTKQQRAELLSKDEMYQRRFVRGEWGIPEGRIHDVTAASLVPGDSKLLDYFRGACRLHRGLDHGDASPTACLWAAVDKDRNIIVYREYYVPNALVSQHRKSITALSEGERYGVQVADPSIGYQRTQKAGKHWSIRDEYADCVGLPRQTAIFWELGDNEEFGTRNRINELLRPSDVPRPHPLTGEMGKWPRLFFVTKSESYPNGCDHLIRELRSQRRERLGTENAKPVFTDDRDESISDHAYDALRYLIASPMGAATVAAARPKAGTFDDWYRRANDKGSVGLWSRLRKAASKWERTA